MFPWWVWVVIVVYFMSPFLALLIGKVIRNRDHQVPGDYPSSQEETMQRLSQLEQGSEAPWTTMLYVQQSPKEDTVVREEGEAR